MTMIVEHRQGGGYTITLAARYRARDDGIIGLTVSPLQLRDAPEFAKYLETLAINPQPNPTTLSHDINRSEHHGLR